MREVKKTTSLVLLVLAVCLTVWATPSNSRSADLAALPDRSKVDLAERCPVCGMVVGGDSEQSQESDPHRHAEVIGPDLEQFPHVYTENIKVQEPGL